jgi:hypothetical protein
MSSEYAQIELCYAYGRALATHPLDLDAFRAILASDVKLSFLPLSFGAPRIEGIDNFLGVVQHVVGGLTDLEHVIDGSEVMESEGRVWYFVCLHSFILRMY